MVEYVHVSICYFEVLMKTSVCGGASQSYANGAWDDAAASPMSEVMSGTLPAGQEVVSKQTSIDGPLGC